MNKAEFIKTIIPIAEYYSKNLTDGLVEVYFQQAEELTVEVFDRLLKNHLASGQGKFWPTFSHILDQAGTESDIATRAGIDFDKNNAIDGTSSFDRQREKEFDTKQRRKIYIEGQKLEWKKTTPIQRLANSVLLPNLSNDLRIES